MAGLVGILILIVADIYLAILALHLVLEPKQFYLSPLLAMLSRATEPLLRPLRSVLRSHRAAALAAFLMIVVAKGLVIGPLEPGLLVFSLASALMGQLTGVVPVLTPIFMSLLWVVDWSLVIVVVCVAVSMLVEPYTVNPLARFAFRVVELAEGALGPLSSRLGAAWQSRLLCALAAVLLDAFTVLVLLVGLSAIAGAAVGPGASFLIGLQSALHLCIDYGFGFFILLLIVGALMSWFSPDPRNPLVRFIVAVSHPLLAPFRRYIPPIAGIDISPVFAIFLLIVSRSVLLRLVERMFGLWG